MILIIKFYIYWEQNQLEKDHKITYLKVSHFKTSNYSFFLVQIY